MKEEEEASEFLQPTGSHISSAGVFLTCWRRGRPTLRIFKPPSVDSDSSAGGPEFDCQNINYRPGAIFEGTY